MFFSAKAEYACIAMIELAARYGDNKPIRLTDVAEKHGIPHRFLLQILLQLKNAGLIASTRGAAGGYQLSRSPDEMTLADIIDVVDPIHSPTQSHVRHGTNESPLFAALREKWDEIEQARRTILANSTLIEMVEAGQGLQYVI